ncbi:Pimeloyl-ACP methyl ester carboxylesterase [Chitinasiproducens palmae]|uniref:Pimeloyl-ACP methyl ester carboxylesterase n=2 Tax=Chitinasiproducens palmae TaxID=1770053 RepID=A0A1H2PV94_9BURK|nr:Pimeloyl-ACP methyl ester carboxylesterase [Chitinasiproducens palmae]
MMACAIAGGLGLADTAAASDASTATTPAHTTVPATPPAAALAASHVPATDPPAMCTRRLDRPERDPSLRAQTLRTPGGAIAYYRFGKGEPIVLVTGYRATLEEWDANFLAALARRHEVIVFDNRGVGQSRGAGDDAAADAGANFGIEDMAHDTATLIRALGLTRPTLLGWSMGGMIAQQLAVDQPELIGRLVLLSTQAPGRQGVPVSPPVLATLDGHSPHPYADVMRVLFPPSAQPAALRCFVDAMFRPLDYAAAPFPPRTAAVQARLLERWRDAERIYAHLRHLSLPTTVIAGRQDAILSPVNATVLARAVPHARLVWFDDGGHALMYQYPDALASALDAPR